MPTAFDVLAEPNRREILGVLREGEACVGELVERLRLSQPAVSKHLRVLREAGMVVARAERQQRIYRLEPGPLQELDEWLEPYRSHWSGALDRLDGHLAATRRAEPGPGVGPPAPGTQDAATQDAATQDPATQDPEAPEPGERNRP